MRGIVTVSQVSFWTFGIAMGRQKDSHRKAGRQGDSQEGRQEDSHGDSQEDSHGGGGAGGQAGGQPANYILIITSRSNLIWLLLEFYF